MSEQQRFAIVLNGGVSLAVWMGGVVHEINTVRSASATDEAPEGSSRPAHDVWQAWKAILDALETKVVVDLVAGTSAGGLNGAVLAHSIATGRELPPMRDLWLEMAALTRSRLLRDDPDDDGWLLSATLLDQEIRGLFDQEPTASLPPEPITLLTTATALTGERSRGTDDYGDSYSYRDSRRVFRFRRPVGDGSNDFTDSRTLALAARASASFPVAFRPVDESADLARLRVQGKGDVGQLMDGGVLDNAPFEPLLEELIRIPTGGRWRRHLLYVTPDVEGPPTETPRVSTWWDELARVVSIVREPDQRLDEEVLTKARASAGYAASAPHHALGQWVQNPQASVLHRPVPGLLAHYRAGRQQALMRWLAPSAAATDSSLELPPGFIPETLEPAAGSGWQWGLSVAIRVMNWWGRTLADTEPSEKSANAYPSLCAMQAHLVELEEQLTRSVDDAGASWDSRVGALTSTCNRDTRMELLERINGTADKVADALGCAGSDLLAASLRLELLSAAFSWFSEPWDLPPIHYTRLTPSAAPLIDVTDADTWRWKKAGTPSQTGAADPPENKACDWPADKLYGERWGHFGAFADREGREHDWLWGRLDAASKLSTVLLNGHSRSDELRQALAAAILTEEFGTQDPAVAEQRLAKGAVEVCETTGGQLFQRMERADSLVWPTVLHRVLRLVEKVPQLERLAPFARALLSARTPAGEKASWRWRLALKVIRWWGRPKITDELPRTLRGRQ